MLTSRALSYAVGTSPQLRVVMAPTSTILAWQWHWRRSNSATFHHRQPAVTQYGKPSLAISTIRRPVRAFDAENTPAEEPDSIKERYRARLFKELGEVAVKLGYDAQAYSKGVKTLEAILGVFTPDMSVMKESEWAAMIVDADSLAKKIVIIKTHFPTLDTVHLLLKKPKVFVLESDELDTRCQQVCHLLKEAKNPGQIISDTPDLLDPAMVASALVTFQRKWPEKDPVKMLEEEGAYWLRFFSDTEMPLDPVYYDGKTWAVPAFDTEAKQQPWKKFIAEKAKKEMERSKAQGFLF